MKLAFVIALAAGGLAAADPIGPVPAPQKLGLFTGVGYLEGDDASGAALTAGLRFRASTHVALTFDLGYGMVGSPASAQDRWWLIPAVAFVIPTRHARFDLGGGVGFGTASGYPTWSSFAAAPFTPTVAYQLFPAARLHVMAATTITRGLDAFARLDVATLLLDHAGVGIRTGTFQAGLVSPSWVTLSLGIQFRLW